MHSCLSFLHENSTVLELVRKLLKALSIIEMYINEEETHTEYVLVGKSTLALIIFLIVKR